MAPGDCQSAGDRAAMSAVDEFSASPGGRTASPHAPDDVVIVTLPPRACAATRALSRREEAFERARPYVEKGQKVRIVAHGATIRDFWPDWAKTCPGLIMTELGAYRTDNGANSTRALSAEFETWLGEIYSGILPGISSGRLLRGSATNRYFQAWFDRATISKEVESIHAHSRIEWIGQDDSFGGPRQKWWALRVRCVFALYFLRAVAGQIRARWHSRRTIRWLRNRAKAVSSTRPQIWAALVGNWQRVNRHVGQSLIDPALAAGVPIGILVTSSLDASRRGPDGQVVSGRDGILDGIAQWRDHAAVTIDQAVRPVSYVDFLSVILSAFGMAMRCAGRLGSSDSVRLSGSTYRLAKSLPHLAMLGTTDLVQALMIQAQFTNLARRYNFANSSVTFSTVGLAETEAVDQLLIASGATTIDYKHGAGGDCWYGTAEAQTSLTAVWTTCDAHQAQLIGERAIVVDRGHTDPAEFEFRPIRNILLISNYLHTDWAPEAFPYAPFLSEHLSSIDQIEAMFPRRFSFRWRPHPADDQREVEKFASMRPECALSRSAALEDDIGWADVVIANVSTTICDVLQLGKPLFLHAPPAYRWLPDVIAVDEARKFFRAEDIREPFKLFVQQRDAGERAGIAADQNARIRMGLESRNDTLFEHLQSAGCPRQIS